eukprot:gene8504-biopygen19645
MCRGGDAHGAAPRSTAGARRQRQRRRQRRRLHSGEAGSNCARPPAYVTGGDIGWRMGMQVVRAGSMFGLQGGGQGGKWPWARVSNRTSRSFAPKLSSSAREQGPLQCPRLGGTGAHWALALGALHSLRGAARQSARARLEIVECVRQTPGSFSLGDGGGIPQPSDSWRREPAPSSCVVPPPPSAAAPAVSYRLF